MIYLILLIAGIFALLLGFSQIAPTLKRVESRPIDAFELRDYL